MLRDAVDGDEAAIEAFLAQHAETSMFLRSNLRQFGLSGSQAPHATRFWLVGDPIAAVFGLTNAGFAMSQAPDAPTAVWEAFYAALHGRRLAGITGEAGQVAAAKGALGVADAAFALDAPEPLYRLPLDRLTVPPGPGQARAPRAADRGVLEHWPGASVEELRLSSPAQRDDAARQRAQWSLASGETRLLVEDGTALAMTSFNARLPDMVQIGGVYTPPERRGSGHARRVVALHLAEAREEGVQTAILFASGPAACRAYEAIGFEFIGRYGLSILKEPVVIGAAG
ncbi:MAG TPA: GNAT family N-acetyltransferase [Rhodobacterales bacterium]|nr:GNAT family N-acetyltransferase [Rhodobacterales bacterium]